MDEADRSDTSWLHVRRWDGRIDVFEHDDTTAHVVLSTGAPDAVDARGVAHRLPGDRPVPEIGAELATARALRRLADGLAARADLDIAGVRQGDRS